MYQAAVLWPNAGYNRYGQPLPGTPQEILVRWVAKRREVMDKSGNIIAIDATVKVGQDIPVDSFMWLGSLDDLPGTAMLPEQDAMLVKEFDGTLDVKGSLVCRQVLLMRYKDSLL